MPRLITLPIKGYYWDFYKKIFFYKNYYNDSRVMTDFPKSGHIYVVHNYDVWGEHGSACVSETCVGGTADIYRTVADKYISCITI